MTTLSYGDMYVHKLKGGPPSKKTDSTNTSRPGADMHAVCGESNTKVQTRSNAADASVVSIYAAVYDAVSITHSVDQAPAFAQQCQASRHYHQFPHPRQAIAEVRSSDLHLRHRPFSQR